MGYELFFRGRREEESTLSVFQRYFARRSHCRQTDDTTFGYDNHFTGVDFQFWIGLDLERSEWVVRFSMNVFRPRFFALEAEPEVAAFVERFGFDVDDPRTQGMGDGPYTREGFLKSWDGANEVSHGLVLASGLPVPVRTAPMAVSERIWRWNHLSPVPLSPRDGELDYPSIYHVERDGRAVTVAQWYDGLPTMLPEVQYILLVRKELATPDATETELKLVTFDELASLLAGYEKRTIDGMPCLVPLSREPVPALLDWFRALTPDADRPTAVWPDTILDEELVEKARAGLCRMDGELSATAVPLK